MSQKIIHATLLAVVAMGIGTQAIADNTKSANSNNNTMMPKMAKGMEKCYGIAKAGQNDCGSATIDCAGMSKTDGAKNAWISVPKGSCEKIVGGSTKEGPAS